MWWIAIAAGSAWMQKAGTARVSLSYQQLVTQRQFASGEAGGLVGPRCPIAVQPGHRAPYDCTTGGRFSNRSMSLSSSVGVHPYLTLDAYVPVVLAASFKDDVGVTNARGLGDLQFGFRSGLKRGAFALAGALHAKAPTGPPGLVDRDVPLGDAQWDVIPGIRVGVSLHPWGWVEMHHQWVIRLRSARSGIDPGDEWTGNLGGGFTPMEWGGLQGRAEWIVALSDEDAFGLSHPGRRLLQARVGPFVRWREWWLQGTVAVPVLGQRWPTAPAWGTTLAWTGPKKASP